MLKAIAASKKKNDKVDARKIADLLRARGPCSAPHAIPPRFARLNLDIPVNQTLISSFP